jgi:hypothetical protein
MISTSGKNRRAINTRRTIYFDTPEWTPCNVGLMPATWMKYREDLEEIVLVHPHLFPDYRRGDVDFDFKELLNPLYELGHFVDCWGTVSGNIERGVGTLDFRFDHDDPASHHPVLLDPEAPHARHRIDRYQGLGPFR